MTQVTGRKPRVSVGLPVFNGERYLPQTLDSLLGQTFEDFELIICDNTSQDRTEEICRSYAAKDSRIRYVRNETNIGGNRNYALAFSLARAEYFRWSAHDDVCAPTQLERCIEILDSRPDVVLAYPKTMLIDGEGQKLSDHEDRLNLQSPHASERFRELTRDLRLCNAIFGLIRTSSLLKTRLIRNFPGADSHFLAELSLHGKFGEVPERLFMRRLHPNAFSSSATLQNTLTWCRPGTKPRMSFMELRSAAEYFGMAMRAPLTARERARVLAHAFRLAAWQRSKLANELLTVGHYFDQSLTAPRSR